MRRWASSRRSNAGWKSMRANPMPDQRDALRSIRTFPQLIKFLRDELEWPIESEDFEELTFDYTPELDFGLFMRRKRVHFPFGSRYGAEFLYCPGSAGT